MRGVRDGTLFGMLEVDIHVPHHLEDKFSEMSPLFCTTEVPMDVISDHMLNHVKGNSIHFIKSLLLLLFVLVVVFTIILNRTQSKHGKSSITGGRNVCEKDLASDSTSSMVYGARLGDH
jgi:hypothetical protein